ncbi:hypothetical protein R1sor_009329 [Riccia sorocarpa]|uniref:DNA-(apurinic or apyrimidinic site) endonuclease n=1 Tax=Riccia sorocarpa TaxID=122646 RepID=A0ABD3HUT6_9MARC
MKRFFQPVARNGAPAKKQAIQESNGLEDGQVNEPSKFLSWNANSFLLRLKNDRAEFLALLEKFDPDVIAIQEVRLPAAGKKSEVKDQGNIKDDTSSAREEKTFLMRQFSVSPLAQYQVWWSLAESKYAGTALLVKHKCKPISVKYCLDSSAPRDKHEPEGRIILAEFRTFRLLVTYAPNNGWREEEVSFQRRRKWDKALHSFVTQEHEKPLIWCGDLNVSHEDIDVSHPDFFRNAKQKDYTPPNTEDIGQPGFTLAERQRFSAILKDGHLVDSYRWLHKTQDFDSGFTWAGNAVGKYRGKRMRIDYFLISEQLVGRLLRSDIQGRGIEHIGYCGSDHCPITLELSASTGSSPQPDVSVKTTEDLTRANGEGKVQEEDSP